MPNYCGRKLLPDGFAQSEKENLSSRNLPAKYLRHKGTPFAGKNYRITFSMMLDKANVHQIFQLVVRHITLLDQADAADFFAMHSGDYIRSDFYSGAWG